MLFTAIITIFTLFTLIKVYIAVMQIGYIAQAKQQPAVLMSASDYLKAANYAIATQRLSIIESLVEYALFIFWVGFGIGWLYDMFLEHETAMSAFYAVFSFLVITTVVTLPLDIYSTFGINKRFGFTKSSVPLYVKDTLISLVITAVVTLGIVYAVWHIIESSSLWWLYTFAFLFVVIIVVNMLFPIVRALFFDKLSAIPDGELKEKLEALFKANNFDSKGLFVSDASRRDSRLNAYFAGIGKQKRVVLYDTLVEKLTPNELVAVLGHELGHWANKDIYKNILATGAMLFITLGLFGNISPEFYVKLGVAATPAVQMILFLLLSPVLFFVLMPLMGRLSRHNEFKADQEGSRLGGKEHLVSALKKLVSENKAFPKSHRVYLFFYATHPPVLERLEAMDASLDA